MLSIVQHYQQSSTHLTALLTSSCSVQKFGIHRWSKLGDNPPNIAQEQPSVNIMSTMVRYVCEGTYGSKWLMINRRLPTGPNSEVQDKTEIQRYRCNQHSQQPSSACHLIWCKLIHVWGIDGQNASCNCPACCTGHPMIHKSRPHDSLWWGHC